MKLPSWKNLFLGSVMALALASLFSCTKVPKADTPEGALHRYVTVAFDARSVDDKKKLIDLSTGDALAYIQSMSDEAFKQAFVDNNLKFVSMKTKDVRQDVSGDVSMVYELSFREGKDPNNTVHTNKKIAYLTFDQEKKEWKIKSTKNMKSFVEVKEALVITPEAPAGEAETEKK